MSQLLSETAIHAQETQEKTVSQSGGKKLTTTAENHLSTIPEEEQNSRVASFARVNFVHASKTRPKIGK